MKRAGALCIVVGLSALAVAQRSGSAQKPMPAAQSASTPAPPSTGKELAPDRVVPPAKTQAELARAFIKKADCKGQTATLSAALNLGAPELKLEEQIAGNRLLAKCARAAKAWKALLHASLFLIEKAPEQANADDVIQAYLGLDDEEHAARALVFIAKKYPKHLAQLTLSASVMACHKSDFKKCWNATTKLIAALDKLQPPPSSTVVFGNHLMHAIAAVALGNWTEYDASIKKIDDIATKAKIDTAKLQAIKARADEVRRTKLFIGEDVTKQVALGTYHLMGASKELDAGALITLRFVNQQKAARSVKVTVELQGVTESTTTTILLPPGQQITNKISPPLKLDFDVGKLRAARDGQIKLAVVDATSGGTLFEQTFATKILPRDHLPLRRNTGTDAMQDTYGNALAWITPNAPEVDAFLKQAKNRLADRTFAGEHRATLPQVKALFDELKARGVSYVVDPKAFDEDLVMQRTRLPTEILASTNAQCLEGTLLYATLIEAIGLRPIVVFIPGHAFVGWQASTHDKGAKTYFLETTMTGGEATFEQAVAQAMRTFAQEAKLKHFDMGASARLDVASLRKAGYSPQPY